MLIAYQFRFLFNPGKFILSLAVTLLYMTNVSYARIADMLLQDSLPGVSTYGNMYIGGGTTVFVFAPFDFATDASGTGVIETERTHPLGMLRFAQGVQPRGFSDSTYVDGYVESEGKEGAFVFPVGADGQLHPCLVFRDSTQTQGVTAAFFAAASSTWNLEDDPDYLGITSYWQVLGSETVELAFNMSATEQLMYQLDSTRVVLLGWTSQGWEEIPAHMEHFEAASLGLEDKASWVVLRTRDMVVPDQYTIFAIGQRAINYCKTNFTIDFSGQPAGVYETPPVLRQGDCCGAGGAVCIRLDITLDVESTGLLFEVASGSIPSGTLVYQVNCGALIPLGQATSLAGGGTYQVTFCAPGNTWNTYRVRALSANGKSTPVVVVDNRIFNRQSKVENPGGIQQGQISDNLVIDNNNHLAKSGRAPILHQNVPNPFSGETILPFYLPEPTAVRIQIQDLTGKVVWVQSELYEAGNHTILVQSSQLGGAGIYLYTLQTADTLQSRKLVLVD